MDINFEIKTITNFSKKYKKEFISIEILTSKLKIFSY